MLILPYLLKRTNHNILLRINCTLKFKTYYIGGSLYVGLRLIFQDGDQIYNFQMIITLLSYVLETYKWLR